MTIWLWLLFAFGTMLSCCCIIFFTSRLLRSGLRSIFKTHSITPTAGGFVSSSLVQPVSLNEVNLTFGFSEADETQF